MVGGIVKNLARTFIRRGSLFAGMIALLGATPGHSQALKEVTFGIPSASLGTALPRVTKEMGFFARNGIDPKFVFMDTANITTSAVVTGSVQMALAGPLELIAAQAKGLNVIAVATAYSGQANTLVLAKSVADKLGVSPSAPINERLKALDGLVLAGTSATNAASVAFNSAAKAVGANIRFTYMAQSAMPAALDSGAVQGFFASAPFWTFPATKGTGVVWIIGARKEIPSQFTPVNASLLIMMGDFAKSNPELVKGIVAAFAEFGNAVEKRPGDVKAAIVKLFPDVDAKSIDLFFSTESSAWKGKPPTAADMAREIDFLKTSGLPIPQLDKLDPAKMVYP
jgi:ABC-type nitrate/sulfonate/bicarbonate transport system substrate-binding protein